MEDSTKKMRSTTGWWDRPFAGLEGADRVSAEAMQEYLISSPVLTSLFFGTLFFIDTQQPQLLLTWAICVLGCGLGLLAVRQRRLRSARIYTVGSLLLGMTVGSLTVPNVDIELFIATNMPAYFLWIPLSQAKLRKAAIATSLVWFFVLIACILPYAPPSTFAPSTVTILRTVIWVIIPIDLLATVNALLTARDKQEKALAETNEELNDALNARATLQAIVSTTASGTWTYSVAEMVMSGDEAWCDMMGVSERAVRRPDVLLQKVHPDDRKLVDDSLKALADSETEFFRIEYRVIVEDASTRWVRDAACIVSRDEHEEPVQIMGAMVDISHLKEQTELLDRANQSMRIVFDNIDQGLLSFSKDGLVSQERSSAVARWLGDPGEGEKIWEWVGRTDADAGDWLLMALDSMVDGLVSQEMVIPQLPERVVADDRVLQVSYKALSVSEREYFLMVLTDVTENLRRQEQLREQQDFANSVVQMMEDRAGFMDFLQSGQDILGRLVAMKEETFGEAAKAQATQHRFIIHTFKGNCHLFKATELADLAHAIETEMGEHRRPATREEIELLEQRWASFRGRLEPLLKGEDQTISVGQRDLEALMLLVEEDCDRPVLRSVVRSWQWEPVSGRLDRAARQVKDLVQRLDKDPAEVRVSVDDTRLEPQTWRRFWDSFAHVVRNVVDHGLETPSERDSVGKEVGRVDLRAMTIDGQFVVEVEDNGRGIAWEAIQRKARQRGLPHESLEHLKAALFAPELSSRDEVSELSGRGVGLAEVLAASQAMGGDIEIDSQQGSGTKFRFVFPIDAGHVMRPLTEDPRARA